jgi:hypothetical protein
MPPQDNDKISLFEIWRIGPWAKRPETRGHFFGTEGRQSRLAGNT